MNPLFRLFRLAFNQATPTQLALGLAANISAEAIGEGEWLKLSPYFEGAYFEKEGQGWKQYKQVVTKEHGQRLVSAFNSQATAAGERFRGLPIYRGHPDADPVRWPDESRLGGIMALEAREDGIYAKVAWNDEGERNRAQGYLVYPSPAWPYDLGLKKRTGRIEPVELRSVGMTNAPRIGDVPAWTNSDPQNQPTEDQLMKQKLLKLLGLPDTATDDEIDAALAAHTKKIGDDKTGAESALAAEKSKVVAANSETAAEKARADKFQALAINSTLTKAIDGRKITAAEKPAYETKLATNFDATVTELEAKQASLPGDRLKLGDAHSTDLTTPNGRRLAFNTAVDGHIANGLSYDAAITAMRSNPEQAALLKAMGT